MEWASLGFGGGPGRKKPSTAGYGGTRVARRRETSSGVDAPGKYEYTADGHDRQVNVRAGAASNQWELRPEWWDHGAVSTPATPRAVFRVSPLVVLFALFLGVCAIPVAFGAPYLWLIYLVPVGIVAWTLRTRTIVDADGLRVRRLVGGRRVPWDALGGLRVDRRNVVHAVLTDGEEVALPAVRTRDLHQLSVASGGRVPDPTAE
jgi:hypothetical protein